MIIRINEVIEITGLPRPTIYRYIAEKKFPAQVPLGIRSVGWIKAEVIAWVNDRISQRNAIKR